jgi:regulator of RNase E activity RraB
MSLPPEYGDVDAMDREVLEGIVSRGADLSEPRDVRHYVYLKSEEQRRAAAEEARNAGWVVEEREPLPAYPNDWLVLASRNAVLSPVEVATSRSAFDELATKFGGEYDGWEAAV